MKKVLILVSIMLVSSLLLGACASTADNANTDNVAVIISIDEFMETKNITDKSEVQVGDTLTVKLGSNRTTGFEWSEQAIIENEALIKQTDHEYVAPNTDVPGTPGEEVWTFEVKEKGETTVSMEYSRPWEGGEKAEWTFELTVTVK